MSKENNNNNNKMSFDDLTLKENLLRGVYSYGFENPSIIQHKSVPVMCKGVDLIAQAQSGTGKTGAFAMGCLNSLDEDLKRTQVLIISPTHELVNQTYDVLENIGKYMNVTMMKVMGGTNMNECRDGLSKDPQIIVGSPGRILDMINRRNLFTDNIRQVILDEADEILSYGFKESIHDIIKSIPQNSQICLFSATIPEDVLDLSNKFLREPENILVKKEALTLEGIRQFFINVKVNDWKLDVLKDLYDTINISQCIIYINSRNKLMDVYENLSGADFPVSYIHGELTSQERKKTMEEFKSGHTRILLSTDLLSRGIDIQQLSLVINFDLPKSKETYIHRIGRSGRYGRKGVSINLVTDRDIDYMKEIESFYDTEIKEMPQNIADYLSV
jgi:translation initiation factor 4A